jgi:hypothetical protein
MLQSLVAAAAASLIHLIPVRLGLKAAHVEKLQPSCLWAVCDHFAVSDLASDRIGIVSFRK